MKDTQTWINEIQSNIDRLKLKNLHHYANFYLDLTNTIASQLREEFSTEKGYNTQITMCNCKKWDIIISW